MKHFAITLLFLCAASINLYAQYDDPCGIVFDVMRDAQTEVDKGNYEMALKILENLKKDKRLQKCPEMKNGVVDGRINDLKKQIDEMPKTKCWECKGTGFVECKECYGTGQDTDSEDFRECFYCDGRGWVICKDCSGKGQIEVVSFEKSE